MRFKILMLMLMLLLVSGTVSALECKEFQENVLWNNDFSYDSPTTTYHAWQIKNKCPGQNCFMEDINVYAKVVNIGQDKNAIGYTQISEPDKTNCEEPSKSSFSRYVAYHEAASIAEMDYGWDCGDAQGRNFCSLKKRDNYNRESCLAIKMDSKKEVLNDIIKINYTWCWEESETNEITEDVIETENEKSSFTSWGIALLVIIIAFIFLKKRKKNGP